LIGSSIGQVFYQRASEKRALGTDLSKLVEGMFTRLLAFGTLPMLILALIGPDIFKVVFGSQWTEAGIYTRILVLPLFFNFAIGSLPLFSVLERQGVGLVFVATLFVGRVAPFLIGEWAQATVRSTLLLFSFVNAVIWLSLCFWQFLAVGLPWQRVLSHIGRYLAYAFPSLLITVMAKWVLRCSSVCLLFVAVVASLPYWALIVRQDPELKKVLKTTRQKVLRSDKR
jgi:O-antigen/teichoic acid export membrane protein